MKKALLATSAIVGASLLAAPAMAGTVGSGDNMSVTLSGAYWFQIHTLDTSGSVAGVRNGRGKGYKFVSPNTRMHLNARNTADNGITYGFEIQWIQGAGNGAGGVDEAKAFLTSDDWGRVEMGDTDDASNRMLLGAFQAHKGLSGPFGGLGGLASQTLPTPGGVAVPALLARTDWQPTTSDDRTKLVYFTPRFSGFQLGVSHTPNANAQGRTFTAVDNTGFQNIWGGGANYVGQFDDFGLMFGVVGEMGDDKAAPTAASPQGNNDLRIWGVGGKVDFQGFTVGANYRDNRKTNISKANSANGADAGHFWAGAVGYQMGPWGVSAWYSEGRQDNTTGNPKTKVDRWGLGAGYAVAPGWNIRADYNELRHRNRGGNAGNNAKIRAAFLTNMFNF